MQEYKEKAIKKCLQMCEDEIKEYSKSYKNSEFTITYSVKGSFLFVLAYNEAYNNGLLVAYLKACFDIGNFSKLLYKDINVHSDYLYNIEDVERATKTYFNIIAMNFNELIK